MSLVKGFPFWSTRENSPPTLGFPTPLDASAILCLCTRAFSFSKYHASAEQEPTKTKMAFHENT